MIKKQQKWIALLVTLTFAWLLQVSTMPLAAASTTEQVSSANAGQAPGYIEQEGDSGYMAKKKSILPIILIGVGVVAVAAVLFLVVLKTKYDVRGTWSVTRSADFYWIGNPRSFVFAGDGKGSGTMTVTGFLDEGTWTVDGKKLHFTFNADDTYLWTFDGTFTDKDTLSGTVNYHDASNDINGTFTATRTSAAASAPLPATMSEKRADR
jgi:hypothetical protein